MIKQIFQMDKYASVLSVWNKNKGIVPVSKFEILSDRILITFSDGLTSCIEIMPPNDSRKYFIIKSADQKDKWVHTVNTYVLEKNPNFKKLLNIINKFITKKNCNIDVQKEATSCLDSSNFQGMMANLNSKNEEILLEKKLLSFVPTSHSSITCKTQRNILYANVSSVVINEYLALHKSIKNTNKILLDLYLNNIYHWRVIYKQFENNELNEELRKNRLDGVEVSITFHDSLYPNYPPCVTVVSPTLGKMLNYIIPALKMLQLSYWTPTRNISYIVQKIYMILNKHAVVDSVVAPQNKLGQLLMKISSLCDISEFSNSVDDEVYISFDKSDDKCNKINKSSNSGTGYYSKTTWDMTQYTESLKDRDNQIIQVFNDITEKIQIPSENICNQLYNSFIIQYIISILDGVSILDMLMRKEMYVSIMTFLQNISYEHYIKLYSIQFRNKCIFEILKKLCEKLGDDEISMIIKSLFDIIGYMNIDIKPSVTQQSCGTKDYVATMEKYKYDNADIIESEYYYKSLLQSAINRTKESSSRIVIECSTLASNVPIHFDASIFVMSDENDISVMRVLMTGPDKTPYENGCFIFDIYLPPDYPQTHPQMWFLNHGGVRFNPNLYDSGKICLSLLGTWPGRDGSSENWNPSTSNIYQLLLSVQSQILVEHPYFNEPSYYNQQDAHSQQSKEYNFNIRYYTMQFAILGLLDTIKYPEFKDIIRDHFKFKKDHVLKICKQWTIEAPNKMKSQYTKTLEEIEKKLANLVIE